MPKKPKHSVEDRIIHGLKALVDSLKRGEKLTYRTGALKPQSGPITRHLIDKVKPGVKKS
jgi:hypothetical protein